MKKRTLKKYTPGGTTGTGATVGDKTAMAGVAAGSMISGLLPEKTYTDDEGNVLGSRESIGGSTLSMATKGASMGLAFGGIGAGIGAGVGAIAGLTKGIIDKNKMDAEMEKQNTMIANKKLVKAANQSYSWVPTNTATNFQFEDGGEMILDENHPMPNAELELQETFQMPDGTIGNVDGPSHEQGGVEVNLPEGTRIWSDKLKYNGKTFAKHTKPIIGKIAKLDKKEKLSDAEHNSKILLNQQLDHYFNLQEQGKQINEAKRSFRKGGLVKYTDGDLVTNPDWKPYPMRTPKLTVDDLVTKKLAFNPNANSKPIINKITNPYIPQTTQQRVEAAASNAGVSTKDASWGSKKLNMPNLDTKWLQENSGEVGQLATAGVSAATQLSRINKLARPKTLNQIQLANKVYAPEYVDYSAERNAIDQTALSAMDEAQRGFGSSASAQAFKNKARLNQLEGKGKSFQSQANTNSQIKNQYLAAKQEAAMREIAANNEIDKYNLENTYGFDTMKTQQKNAITGMVGNTVGQVFGNQSNYKNQLESANILANQYDPSVLNDMIKNGRLKVVDGKVVKGRNGGMIEYADGGSVKNTYHQALQTKAVKPNTITSAQIMDDEYTKALANPNIDSYKSSVTGLDYKVIRSLPKSEKRALVVDMWRDAHEKAPTQKQIESGVKAIEGRKVSSPKAKTLGELIDSKWKPGNLTEEEKLKYKNEIKESQLRATLNSSAKRLYEETEDYQLAQDAYNDPGRFDVSSGHAGYMLGQALRKGNFSETDGINTALLLLQAATNLKKNPKSFGPKKPQYFQDISRDLELAKQKSGVGKNSYKSRQNRANTKSINDYYNQVPEPDIPRYVKNIIKQEDEEFIYEMNRTRNKKIEHKLNIAEGADRLRKPKSLKKK